MTWRIEQEGTDPVVLLGRYQDVLQGVTCDALVFDAPYSDKTHGGQRHGRRKTAAGHWTSSRGLTYDHWKREDVAEFCDFWQERCRGWICSLTDSELAPVWQDELRRIGRYVFHPIPCVMRGMNVRLQGDGPSSWCVWLIVARPKHEPYSKWGTLPGAYIGNPTDGGAPNGKTRKNYVVGGKPLWLMRAIVEDYSRPGDVVCDPTAGAGTTLRAARMTGRKSIGAEVNPEHFELAREHCGSFPSGSLFDEVSEPESDNDHLKSLLRRLTSHYRGYIAGDVARHAEMMRLIGMAEEVSE